MLKWFCSTRDSLKLLDWIEGKCGRTSSFWVFSSRSLVWARRLWWRAHTKINEKSTAAIALSNISTRRRIVVTKTPIQNNFLEYHAIVQLWNRFLLGTVAQFIEYFAKPIKTGSRPIDLNLTKKSYETQIPCVAKCSKVDYIFAYFTAIYRKFV